LAKRLLLRDAENFSQDMIQRVLGGLFWNTPGVAGVGTGYAAGIIGKLTGVATSGHMAVTADGATMVLTILPGWATIFRDAGASTYDPRALFAESDANDSVTITANATGSTRNDTVCLKIDQNTAPTSDGSNLVSFVAIAGQSGGGLSNAPVDGNLYLPLANVAVANGAMLLTQGVVTDKRSSILGLGSPLLVPPGFGAFPASLYGSHGVKLDDQSTASAASLTLTVPAGALFRTLWIQFTGRSDQAGAQALNVQFNADVAANYDSQFVTDVNTTLTGQAPTIAGTAGTIGTLCASGAAAGAVSEMDIYVQNADSTTLRKAWKFSGGRFDTDAAANSVLFWGHGQWRNVTTAITSIKLAGAAGNLVNARGILWGLP
jgi:hypothetical protein